MLNREQRYFPGNIHIWAYLHDPEKSTAVRQSGIIGRMSIGGKPEVFSEIAFPPFGLVMSFDAVPVQHKLRNLTHFSQYGINARDVVYLKLPVLPVVSFYPGDFRTVDEIKKTAEENRQIERYQQSFRASANAEQSAKARIVGALRARSR